MSVVTASVPTMSSTVSGSNCSLGLPVDVYWHERPDVRSVEVHLDLITDALMAVLKAPAGRRWNPYNEPMVRSEFRHRLAAAARGRLVPVDHVKSIEHPLAADLFEIRWQGITVSEVVDGQVRHRDVQVRLLHAEPLRLGVIALALHAHEKTIVDGDRRATREAQDAEIVAAVEVYADALPRWLRSSLAGGLDRPPNQYRFYPMSVEDPRTIARRADALVEDHEQLLSSLIELRKKHRLSQSVVAERMGVSQPTVAGFERYDANPTLSTIRRYAVSVGARLRTSVIDDCDTCADGRAFSAAVTGLPFDFMPVATYMPAPGAWTADPERMTLRA